MQAEREKLTELMFEGFLVDGLFMAEQPLLALYGLGKLSGCVADIGHDKCGAFA